MANKVMQDLVLRVTTDLAELQKGVKGISGQLASFSKGLKAIGGIVGAAFSAQEIIRFGAEVSKAAAQVDTVRRSFERLGGSQRYIDQLKVATRGTVSELQLLQAAVKFKNFQLPLENLGELLQFVQLRAQQTGESFEYLFNSLVEGLSKESTLRLDNLGVSQERLNKFVKDGIPLVEAFTRVAVEELNKAGGVIEDVTTKTDRWKIKFQEIGITIGSKINTALEDTLTLVDAIAGNDFNVAITRYQKAAQVFEKVQKAITELNQARVDLKAGKIDVIDFESLQKSIETDLGTIFPSILSLEFFNGLEVKVVDTKRVQSELDSFFSAVNTELQIGISRIQKRKEQLEVQIEGLKDAYKTGEILEDVGGYALPKKLNAVELGELVLQLDAVNAQLNELSKQERELAALSTKGFKLSTQELVPRKTATETLKEQVAAGSQPALLDSDGVQVELPLEYKFEVEDFIPALDFELQKSIDDYYKGTFFGLFPDIEVPVPIKLKPLFQEFGQFQEESLDSFKKASDKLIKETTKEIEKIAEKESEVLDFSGILENLIGNGISLAVDAAFNNETFNGVSRGLLFIAGILEQLGAALIAVALGIEAFKQSLATLNPAVALVAGGGLIATAAAFRSIANQQAERFASGGIVGGSGYQIVGERGAELVSFPKGTSIANNYQTQRMMQSNFGEVQFRIDGDDLVGVLRKKNISNTRF